MDFYSDEARLIIELDSEAHSEPRQEEQDRERDQQPLQVARGARLSRAAVPE